MGEANAGPYLGGGPDTRQHHELVQWVAVRLGSGERFEALLAPRQPLTTSPMKYGRIDEQALRAGLSLDAFAAAWRSFSREDDVLCAWGPYAVGLFEKEGFTLPARRVDLRKVAGDYLKRTPGSTDGLVQQLGLAAQPEGMGRAGERLGQIVALTQWLRGLALPAPPV